jgi:large repetitive protein
VTPAHAVGVVDVVITNSAGASAITTKDRFKYAATLESVSPNSGPLAGGTSVTVTGTGFSTVAKATVFKFGKAAAKSVVCASSTSCTMTTPAGLAAGAVTVLVTVNKVTSPANPAVQFTYS